MQSNTVSKSWNLENIYHTVAETSALTSQKSRLKYKKIKLKANLLVKSQTNWRKVKQIAKGPSHYGEKVWINKKSSLKKRPEYHKKIITKNSKRILNAE